MTDPFAAYQKKWGTSASGEQDDPFAAYESKYGKTATVEPSEAPPADHGAASLARLEGDWLARNGKPAPPVPRPENQPRYDRFGEPLNDAARDEDLAAPVRSGDLAGPVMRPSTRTVALGEALGLGRFALGMADLFPGGIRAVFPSEPRGTPSIRSARTGPPIGGYTAQPAGRPGPSDAETFLKGLNPFPTIEKALEGDPEAFGEALGALGGMCMGGQLPKTQPGVVDSGDGRSP